jgi:hypothetical protein
MEPVPIYKKIPTLQRLYPAVTPSQQEKNWKMKFSVQANLNQLSFQKSLRRIRLLKFCHVDLKISNKDLRLKIDTRADETVFSLEKGT